MLVTGRPSFYAGRTLGCCRGANRCVVRGTFGIHVGSRYRAFAGARLVHGGFRYVARPITDKKSGQLDRTMSAVGNDVYTFWPILGWRDASQGVRPEWNLVAWRDQPRWGISAAGRGCAGLFATYVVFG